MVIVVTRSPGFCGDLGQRAKMEVKTEPREEADLPAAGDYQVEEEAAEGDHEEEFAEGDQGEEAANLMTPVQSQQYISDIVHEILQSWEQPSVAGI